MKWKNKKVMKLVGGLFGNHTETCRAVNRNADVLIECCQKIEELETKINKLEQMITEKSEEKKNEN